MQGISGTDVLMAVLAAVIVISIIVGPLVMIFAIG